MQVVNIQRTVMHVKWLPTVLCYGLLIGALNYFILAHRRPVLDATFLGIVIYGVFEMTNLALFKKYKWQIAVMDTLWGGVLFGLTTWIIYLE